jgi:hypothetical protein
MIPCVGRVVFPSGAVPLASSVHDDFSAKARPVVAARAPYGPWLHQDAGRIGADVRPNWKELVRP